MSNDPDQFSQAFQQVQALAATFAAGSKHYLSLGCQEQASATTATPSNPNRKQANFW